jgi:hypothetical protein
MREGDHFETSGVCGRIILKMNLLEVGVGAWSVLIWLRIGTGGGLL